MTFIVVEGVDGSGKSTLIKALTQHYEQQGKMVYNYVFPDRTTTTGKIINEYLQQTNASSINNEVLHLLFSANRYEKKYIINN